VKYCPFQGYWGISKERSVRVEEAIKWATAEKGRIKKMSLVLRQNIPSFLQGFNERL
jgi:hypothetical protein